MDEDEDEDDLLGLSEQHLKALRKEVALRRKTKCLATHFLSKDEGVEEAFGGETLDAVLALLADAELVEVRAISISNIKLVTETLECFLNDLADRKGDEIFMVSRKGHAAVLFRAKLEEEEGPRIYLRTSGKRPWKRKMKPLRDTRGQIIPGEYA